jgi:hypothetical protein
MTTGMGKRVHVSEAAADLLIRAGKRRWLAEREDRVETVEKGEMKTYWLTKGNHHNKHGDHDASSFHGSSLGESGSDSEDDDHANLESEHRWIDFNVEVFIKLLKQIIARRDQGSVETYKPSDVVATAEMPLEEVKEIIELPKFSRRAAKRMLENEDVEVSDSVVRQLREFVSEIAGRYNDNPFHSKKSPKVSLVARGGMLTLLSRNSRKFTDFAHASYVVMSTTKYLNRIIAATEADLGEHDDRFRSSVQAALHSHTYGITSDPLTQVWRKEPPCVIQACSDHCGSTFLVVINSFFAVCLRFQRSHSW